MVVANIHLFDACGHFAQPTESIEFHEEAEKLIIPYTETSNCDMFADYIEFIGIS